MGPEMLLLVGWCEGSGRGSVSRGEGEGWGSAGQQKGVRGREALPPITIIFHHPNYIVECIPAVACAHPVPLLGKERSTET